MIPLAVLRHGPTLWNESKHIQGQRDIPLSEKGRRTVRSWRLPPELRGRAWWASPLGRARETAALLGLPAPRLDPRLMELHWGTWEGERRPDLIARLGDTWTAQEAAGFGFQTLGGESFADLRDRLTAFLLELGRRGEPAGVVCHRGVIRVLYAMATGWDMRPPEPERLRNGCLHEFTLDEDGRPSLVRLNLSLAA